MKFCTKLNQCMENKGITQADIVKASNLSESMVYYLCSGRSKNPTLLTLLELCNVLEISMNELLDGVEAPAPSKNKVHYEAVQLPTN